MNLKEIIKEEILKNGKITFKRFMQLALYHPQYGYYSKAPAIGKKGDFYTSVSVGSIFGKALSMAIKAMLEFSGSNAILEIGAGDGTLAKDILERFDASSVKYIILEKSPKFIKIQKENLRQFQNISWINDLDEITDFEGVIFSNEVFDALPVHIVEKREHKLFEIYVGLDDKCNFIEVLGEPSTPEILEYFEKLKINLPSNFRTEVNLEGVRLIKELGKRLKTGFIMTIDYGYPSRELYQPYRSRGTLMCYYRHKATDNPYENVGNQDITSHVNFSALAIYGKEAGLDVCGFTNQANFLIDSGILDIAKDINDILKLKTLIVPEHGMGETFKVLIQSKGVGKVKLSCLKNAPKRPSYEL